MKLTTEQEQLFQGLVAAVKTVLNQQGSDLRGRVKGYHDFYDTTKNHGAVELWETVDGNLTVIKANDARDVVQKFLERLSQQDFVMLGKKWIAETNARIEHVFDEARELCVTLVYAWDDQSKAYLGVGCWFFPHGSAGFDGVVREESSAS